MVIKVSDKQLGECSINVKTNINKSEEYLIKSLCALQLICMNSEEDLEKFAKFREVMYEAVNKIELIFNNNEEELNVSDKF